MRCYEIVTRDAAGQKVALIDHYYPGRWSVLPYDGASYASRKRTRTLTAAMHYAEGMGAVAFDAPRTYGEVTA